MMMTCRLLCALLVLALCCCPSVCVTGSANDKEQFYHHYDHNDDDHNDYHHDYHYDDNNYNDRPLYHYTSTNCDHDDHTSTNCDHHYHGGAKHYDYRGANYEDTAHRHFFAKLTAVPAALRGLCPWCSRLSVLAYSSLC
ncbi:putative mucin TcMUCI [Trypanosoma cruzi]|nr:putative mucin TcMUCI [Trypanosoma cruzi]